MIVAAFRANGLVTLTTDFGTREPFVGVMKSVIRARAPEVDVIDLMHGLDAFAAGEAGFWLWRTVPWFAAGTVHVAVVDPGVGSARDIVIAESGNQLLLAPDNGLLAPLEAHGLLQQRWRLDVSKLSAWGTPPPSATFHGRDIFAPLAAELAAGRCQPPQVASSIERVSTAGYVAAAETAGRVHGVVMAVDRFGNLISNIEAQALQRFGKVEVVLGDRQMAWQRTYADVPAGEYLALVNSFGVVEVARSHGSAADGLGCGKGAILEVREASKRGPNTRS